MAIKSDHTDNIQFHGFRYIKEILKKLSLFTPYYGTNINNQYMDIYFSDFILNDQN